MRERVELLGGRLEVTSAPGSGTRVQVLLPLAGPKALSHE
jgi:signal transduction histidine kinase